MSDTTTHTTTGTERFTVEANKVHENGTWFTVYEDGVAIEDFRDPDEARKYAADLNKYGRAA